MHAPVAGMCCIKQGVALGSMAAQQAHRLLLNESITKCTPIPDQACLQGSCIWFPTQCLSAGLLLNSEGPAAPLLAAGQPGAPRSAAHHQWDCCACPKCIHRCRRHRVDASPAYLTCLHGHRRRCPALRACYIVSGSAGGGAADSKAIGSECRDPALSFQAQPARRKCF